MTSDPALCGAVSFRAAADPKGLASRRARERARKGVRGLNNDLCVHGRLREAVECGLIVRSIAIAVFGDKQVAFHAGRQYQITHGKKRSHLRFSGRAITLF